MAKEMSIQEYIERHPEKDAFATVMFVHQSALIQMSSRIEVLNNELSHIYTYNPIEYVKTRLKTPESIMKKLKKQGRGFQIPALLENVNDIAGIRILCQFVEDIPKVIEMVRKRKDMTVIEERDYITNTKPSGYRSYHMIIRYPLFTALGEKTVPAEIQIRTNAMNFWATAEHSLRYKYSGNIPQDLQDRLKNCAEAAFHLDQEMATIREEITNAQRLNEIKNNLVANILENIQNLYFVAKLDDMNEINKEFIRLWNGDDMEALKKFNEKLNIMAEMYRV